MDLLLFFVFFSGYNLDKYSLIAVWGTIIRIYLFGNYALIVYWDTNAELGCGIEPICPSIGGFRLIGGWGTNAALGCDINDGKCPIEPICPSISGFGFNCNIWVPLPLLLPLAF